jgi:VanZ family protein
MNHDPYRALPTALRQPVHMAQNTLQEEELFGIPGHIGEYILLGVSAANAFIWKQKKSIWVYSCILAGCMLYALSDEFHQLFVPGRAFQLSDLGLDLFGIIIGLLLYWVVTRRSLKISMSR